MESEGFSKRKYEEKNLYSYQNIRKINASKYLSLRKQKRNQEINTNIRNKLNLLNEPKYVIHLHLLKTNNDNIRNFFIDSKRPEYTMNNLKYLLGSKNDDEVKFGLYAVRKYFQTIIKEINDGLSNINNHIQLNNNVNGQINDINNNINGEDNYPLYNMVQDRINISVQDKQILNLFLGNDIINLIIQLINKCQIKNEIAEQINIFESIWILINMSAIYSKNENYQSVFYSYFIQNNNYLSFLSLIDSKKFPLEIILNVLVLLSNIIYDSKIIRNHFKKTSLTSILYTYLKTEQNINSEVIVKIIKVLNGLYNENVESNMSTNINNNDNNINIEDDDLDTEAYLTLYKIFSISLISFRNKEFSKYCLDMLDMLSNKDIPELINCFADIDLLSALNDIIFSQPIINNQKIINLILNIFCNLISKDNEKIKKEIIEPGMLIKFYNNLLNKYKDEKIIINNQIEENILVTVNNLIYYQHDYNVKYIFGEGKEILNFFLSSAKSCHPKARFLGLKSFVNIFCSETDIIINKELIYDIAKVILLVLNNDYSSCYYTCSQCLYLLTKVSEVKNFSNEFRFFLIKKGFDVLLEKIRTKLINDTKDKSITIEQGKNFNEFLEEINSFLNKD